MAGTLANARCRAVLLQKRSLPPLRSGKLRIAKARTDIRSSRVEAEGQKEAYCQLCPPTTTGEEY